MPKTDKIFKMGELFCGAGGIALGAKLASDENTIKIKHTWANDIERSACDTYIHNICPNEPDNVICKDVKELDIKSLSSIDGFSFGFPCNDFSLVGEQKGLDGSYGGLFRYGCEVLKAHKPKWFLAENVGGLTSVNKGSALDIILNEFKKCGYKIYPHLYKFEDYGVPQARHRIIIVGIRNDLPFDFLPPNPMSFKDIDNTSKNALENPPIKPNAFNNKLTKQCPIVVERLKYIKAGQNAFTANLPQELQLKVKGAKISQIYKRLDPKKPAYTVTGSGGGGTHIYHYSEPRALTNRERARLQTFPDNFEFLGSKESVRKQIGMAVPVMGAKIVFDCILKTFAGQTYSSIPCNIKGNR